MMLLKVELKIATLLGIKSRTFSRSDKYSYTKTPSRQKKLWLVVQHATAYNVFMYDCFSIARSIARGVLRGQKTHLSLKRPISAHDS